MVAISLRSRRRLLVCLNIVLATGLVGCVICAFVFPPELEPVSTNILQPQVLLLEPDEDKKTKPLSHYAAIYKLDLRKSLFERTKRAVPKLSTSLKNSKLVLLGTIVESGYEYGLFRTKGKNRVIPVGNDIDGVKLMTVEDGLVTLKLRGEVVPLKMKKEKKPPKKKQSRVPKSAHSNRKGNAKR